MDTNALLSANNKIGEVFTPLIWATWLIQRWGVFDRWLNGVSVCDPTAGRGVFALALFDEARRRNVKVTPELLSRLRLIEINSENLRYFRAAAEAEYGIRDLQSICLCCDVIIDTPSISFDILVGNPPWANFTELPTLYKESLKSIFVAEGLVPDRKAVLLGSARTDIAALVLKRVIGRMLNSSGAGYFFVPLSLFSGDDAHRGFRDYKANGQDFCVEEVLEFVTSKVFEGVGTSYACAHFTKAKKQVFPVPYYREVKGTWVLKYASPLKASNDQWRITSDQDSQDNAYDNIDICLAPAQKPRQGINTCGANSIFIFDDKPEFVPDIFLFPLVTKDLWKDIAVMPCKWILLPYDKQSCRPLNIAQIQSYADLWKYLSAHKSELECRKGTLIQSAVQKGIWWALLGVGPYSFAPYKVIWQAYGNSNFSPVILGQHEGMEWQANQAMQAFIPCWNLEDAQKITAGLKNPRVAQILTELNGAGKCNWAQPGKIKKVISFDMEQYHQPLLLEDEKTNYQP
ncbi:MAG: hypothetical protein WCO57_09135 [Verrucomicrobiota bacterium]